MNNEIALSNRFDYYGVEISPQNRDLPNIYPYQKTLA